MPTDQGGPVTKQEFIDQVANRTDLSKKDAVLAKVRRGDGEKVDRHGEGR